MMKKSCVGIFIFVIVVVLAGVALISQVIKPNATGSSTSTSSKLVRSSFTLPIQSRNYLIGLSGYFPANFPNPSNTDAQAFYPLVQQAAEVYGIHTVIDDMNIVDVSAKQLPQITIELVTSVKDDNWSSDTSAFVTKLSEYLTKYPQIKYAGIGNEVNFNMDLNTVKWNNYFAAYKQVYAELKNKFPERKFFATFQYEALIGKGKITGRPMRAEWETLQQMEPYLDVVALTLYPGMDFAKPDDIPLDYLKQLRSYSQKPIVITETGWHTRPNFTGAPYDLIEPQLREQDQVDYLKRLTQILESENVEFVNWFSLHDLANWETPREVSVMTEGLIFFDSFGLRKNDGTEKKAWQSWLELKSI